MVVIIKCELSEPCKLNASKIHEIADCFSEVFEGKCECFDIEQREEED